MSNTPQTEAMRLAEFKDLEYWPAGVGLTDWVESVCAEMLRLDAALADELNNRDVLDKMLTQCIAERDQLRAQLAKAVAEEREACAKVCEEFMRLTLDAQLGEPSDLHNVMLRQIANLGHGELAGAIRARSNP